MADIIGLEPGTTDELTAVTGATVTSTGQRSGEYALGTTANSDEFEFGSSSSAQFSIRIWVKGSFGAAGNLVSFRDSSDVVLVRIDMTALDKLTIGVGGSGTSTATLTTNEYNEISIRVVRGTGSSGLIAVRINGSEETLDTAGTWSADTVNNILIESPWSSSHTWDDIVTATSSVFPNPNSKIVALRPNAVSGEDDFTLVGGDTNKWEALDDVVVDDATYIEFTATDAADQEFGLSTITVDSILAFRQATRSRRSGGGATTMSMRSQDSDETSQSLQSVIPAGSGSWEYHEGQTFTSSSVRPVNQTELDRWQVKFRKGSGGRDMDISEYWWNLEYTVSSTVVQDVIQGLGILVRSR